MSAMPPGGDQRLRRRVTTVIGSGISSTGIVSKANSADITFCNRHYVSIVPSGTVTGGTLSIRARSVGASGLSDGGGYTPFGAESLDLSTLKNWTFDVVGFFDAFLINVTGAITGGTVAVVVNSTIED